MIEGVDSLTLPERIKYVLDTLTYREREVFKMRRGVDGPVESLEEVASFFQITPKRAEQIERRQCVSCNIRCAVALSRRSLWRYRRSFWSSDMTKTELLLKVAIAATGWGDGAKFDMGELVGECGYIKDVEEHYNVVYPTKDNLWCPSDEEYEWMTKEQEKIADERMDEEEQQAWKMWEDSLDKLQQDSLTYLHGLAKQNGAVFQDKHHRLPEFKG